MSNNKYVYVVAILAVFFTALYFGLAGVDYGAQWDPNFIKGNVNKFIRTGNVLTGEYVYPPGASYIASATLIPYALPLIKNYGFNFEPTQRYLLDLVLRNDNLSFLLNLRRTFVFFTMLAVAWVGLAASQRNWQAGLIAALALGLSWEVSYHSRILHPDGPNMQFVALSLLLALLGFYRKRPLGQMTWFGLASLAAAAAAATKYTSGFALFMVLILAYGVMRAEKLSTKAVVLRLFGLTALYAIGFVVLVPGVVFETETFVRNLKFAQATYAGGYGFQTVEAGWDYFSRVMSYLFQVAFSHQRILALLIPSLALVGAYSLYRSKDRNDRWLFYSVFLVPFIYILYLSTNRALFVRNLLITFPSIAILGGFGFVWLLQKLKTRPLFKYALLTFLAVVCSYNAYWLAFSAQTIQERNSEAHIDRALAEIAMQSDQTVYITPVALRQIGNRELPANVALDYSPSVDLILFAYRGDTRDEEEAGWPVNAPGIAPLTFGPIEMNFDWYANWPGAERLVLAPVRLAWQDSAPLARFQPTPAGEMPLSSADGVLEVDGEQFYIQKDAENRLFFLNSANPYVVALLRLYLGEQVQIIGRPHDIDRANDWYVVNLNGIELPTSVIVDEYNTFRFLANRSEGELGCLKSGLDPSVYRAMIDGRYDLLDLSDAELQIAVDCSN